jgi:hypothetical protein
MDKTTKTILIVIAAVVLVCVCLGAVVVATGLVSFNIFANQVQENVSENPEVAVRVGAEIADFEVPSGFGSPYSIHFGDVTLIQYSTDSEKSYLLIAQFPEGTSINIKEMLRIIQEGSGNPDSIWYNTDTTLVEEKSVNIRGQVSTLQISEGTSSGGVVYRVATTQFQGRGGPALLLIGGQLEEWDEDMVEQFVSSIR